MIFKFLPYGGVTSHYTSAHVSPYYLNLRVRQRGRSFWLVFEHSAFPIKTSHFLSFLHIIFFVVHTFSFINPHLRRHRRKVEREMVWVLFKAILYQISDPLQCMPGGTWEWLTGQKPANMRISDHFLMFIKKKF